MKSLISSISILLCITIAAGTGIKYISLPGSNVWSRFPLLLEDNHVYNLGYPVTRTSYTNVTFLAVHNSLCTTFPPFDIVITQSSQDYYDGLPVSGGLSGNHPTNFGTNINGNTVLDKYLWAFRGINIATCIRGSKITYTTLLPPQQGHNIYYWTAGGSLSGNLFSTVHNSYTYAITETYTDDSSITTDPLIAEVANNDTPILAGLGYTFA